MENMSRLRRHIGESARLIDVDSKAEPEPCRDRFLVLDSVMLKP